MRLQQHINEEMSIMEPDDFNDLKKGCIPYLKDVKKVLGEPNHFLYRGFQRREGDFSYRKPRRDRRPSDSSPEWHKTLDYLFNEKFNVKARSKGVFCKIVTPTGYGMDYMVFPLGDYSCIWSDLISDAYHDEPMVPPGGDWRKMIPAGREFMPTYYKGGIDKTVKSLGTGMGFHEVALICRAYYMVDIKFTEQIEDMIRYEI